MVLGVSYLRVLAQRPTGCCSASIYYIRSKMDMLQRNTKTNDTESGRAATKTNTSWTFLVNKCTANVKCSNGKRYTQRPQVVTRSRTTFTKTYLGSSVGKIPRKYIIEEIGEWMHLSGVTPVLLWRATSGTTGAFTQTKEGVVASSITSL